MSSAWFLIPPTPQLPTPPSLFSNQSLNAPPCRCPLLFTQPPPSPDPPHQCPNNSICASVQAELPLPYGLIDLLLEGGRRPQDCADRSSRGGHAESRPPRPWGWSHSHRGRTLMLGREGTCWPVRRSSTVEQAEGKGRREGGRKEGRKKGK